MTSQIPKEAMAAAQDVMSRWARSSLPQRDPYAMQYQRLALDFAAALEAQYERVRMLKATLRTIADWPRPTIRGEAAWRDAAIAEANIAGEVLARLAAFEEAKV